MKKRKIKKQAVFNAISLIILSSLFIYYLGRFIYYKVDSEKEVVYSDLLASRLIEQNENHSLDSHLTNIDDVYYFNSTTDSNYVKYKGFMWRIVKINEDNTLTLIMEDSITNMAHDTIINWLNKSNKKLSGIFETMLNGTSLLTNTKTCSDIYNSDTALTCTETTDYKITVLSINDYINTGANKGFINNGTDFWITNKYNDTKYIYINEKGEISNSSPNIKHGVRPVITFNSDVTIITGNGTVDNPYVLETEENNKLSDLNAGAYIEFNDVKWRIVSKTGSRIKVVSTECLKDSNGKCITKTFATNTNDIDEEDDNLISYLNTTYYESIKDKKYITNGPFYIGEYSLTDNDYTKCLSKSTFLKVGLLSVAEPFIFDVENTFLITTNPDNILSVYTINENGDLFENAINSKLYVRPSLYLKGDTNLKEGKGTYLEPYILGD